MSDLYLGIDTSNYKTSVAVVDEQGFSVFECSEYLEVPEGKRGLRQSEAFFHHSNRLPDYIRKLTGSVNVSDIRAIGVSSRPRRIEGSYMPCFLAGVNLAHEAGALMGIPVYEFSHQEGHAAAIIEDCSICTDGHAAAVIEDCGISTDGHTDISAADDGYCRSPYADCCSHASAGNQRSLLFHLSGGTTEFLLCNMDDMGYDLEIIGGTKDISIGQLIDRAGVAMGMKFPSGMYMDRIACDYIASSYSTDEHSLMPGVSTGTTDAFNCGTDLLNMIGRVRITDGWFNLSGTETQIMNAIGRLAEEQRPALIYTLFVRIGEILRRSAAELADRYNADTVYMAGGVASSEFMRSSGIGSVTASESGRKVNIVFGRPELSGDNAAGTARLARRVSMNMNSRGSVDR